MSITSQTYVKRAEECERLAAACIAKSNRDSLLYTAAGWRAMAEDAEGSPTARAPDKSDSSHPFGCANPLREAQRGDGTSI
jgi:hypothetical protein